jgi:hypothetical protein
MGEDKALLQLDEAEIVALRGRVRPNSAKATLSVSCG